MNEQPATSPRGRAPGSGRGADVKDRKSTRAGRRQIGGISSVSQLRHRPPWYDRLEARITISLVTIGILCVGASSYLVALAIGYYDRVSEQQVAQQDETLQLVEPYYEELARAQREAFAAQTKLLPHELAAIDVGELQPFLVQWMHAHPNVLEVSLVRPGLAPLTVHRPSPESFLEPEHRVDISGWIHVRMDAPLLAAPLLEAPLLEAPLLEAPLLEAPRVEAKRGLVEVTWAVDPSIQRRHQRLGELARELGTVEVDAGGEDFMVERDEVRRALVAALGVASLLVLFVAILAGILIARRTTRKVSDLSKVMRTVASGDLSVRAPRLGKDELGQLARAFNGMLDELEHTRRRIAYLQRVGAWQEMARRIAHEIKNPLTPIQLAAQQLREKDPGDDPRFSKLLRDSVEIIEDEVEALRRMVTSFSQFAKVPEVELEPVALSRILTEFERAYSHLDTELDVELGEDLTVLGDRQLLKQVLVNLVENAALSVAEAGTSPAKIHVWAGRLDGAASLVVEDNGPGIPLARRDLVFEPYETTREHGTGLGLAIVKKIVLDHGGEVSAGASDRLGGARFVVRLRAPT